MEKMKQGELRQFFYSTSSPELLGKIFIVISTRETSTDILVNGVLHRNCDLVFVQCNSKAINETG